MGTVVSGNTFQQDAGIGGNEISITSFDSGGVWPAFSTIGQNNAIVDNKFILGSSGWGILAQGGVTGLVIKDNVFSRVGAPNPDDAAMYIGAISASVSGNVSADYVVGPSIVVGTTTVIPDGADTILLSGSATSISQIEDTAQQGGAGKITYIAPGTPGTGCTSAPTVTITNTGGTDGAATALLSGPTPAGVAAYSIANSGSGITSATASVSGGGCTGTLPGTVYIGYPNAMDGRTVTIINESSVTQTLVDGTWIKLAGGSNVSFTANSTMTFRIANAGIWYETSRALQ